MKFMNLESEQYNYNNNNLFQNNYNIKKSFTPWKKIN